MTLRITVDMDLCESHGQCVFAAPEVFWFDEDDVLQYDPTPDAEQDGNVAAGAAACPVRAIRFTQLDQSAT